MGRFKSHLEIDRVNVTKYIKALTKEAKEAGVKII